MTDEITDAGPNDEQCNDHRKNGAGLPPSNSTHCLDFRNELEEERQENAPFYPEHNYTHYWAQNHFAQAKDVGRYYRKNYDSYTTVMLTLTADESPLELLEQTKSFNPAAVTQERYRAVTDLSSDYAGVTLLAPKYDLPPPNSTDVLTHVHMMVWLPGLHDRAPFVPILEKHIEKVQGAGAPIDEEDTQHPPERAITVWQHESKLGTSGEEVWISKELGAETYRGPTQHGKDKHRGSTSTAPYELAENMPLMNVKIDALDLHDLRAFKWFATLSRGADGAHDTAGARRWQTFGDFIEAAASIEDTFKRKTERDLNRAPPHDLTPAGTTHTYPLGTVNHCRDNPNVEPRPSSPGGP